MKAALPVNEIIRIKALHDLAILDSAREQSFDDVAQVAMQLCDVPIAVVSLVDVNRQWFKSCIGVDASETPRDVAFCAHAILAPDEVLVIEDATKDNRFSDNDLVLGPPHIRFYAGAPLVTDEGLALGTLCVIDYKPRQLNSGQLDSLKALARQVMQLLRLKKTHDVMQQYSVRMQALADAVPIFIGELNAQQRYTFVNKKYQDWLGIDADDMIDKAPMELLAGDIAKKITAAIALCLQGEIVNIEVILASGTVLAMSYLPRVEEGVEGAVRVLGVYEVAIDITERKRLEQMKTEFISTLSHELRTPLTSISGALGLIANSMLGTLPEKAMTMLTIAYKNSQRLTMLINDLLDMEKLLAGKMHFDMKFFPLFPLVQQAMLENKPYADHYTVTFVIENHIEQALIHIDSFRLQQILSSFISNAAKYSPRGGQVEIVLTRVNSWIRISVRDYGAGIPEKFKVHMFEKFSQADASDTRQHSGAGLGLAISKELVEHMGGRIGFVSKPIAGTHFYAEFKEVFI
ncbi:MAG: GAF domain-containing sensor histidine kinase [Pseudomonadota bacterium]